MSDTQNPGDWPDASKPGYPQNPERDGWHWVDRRGRNQRPWLWGSGAQAWLVGDSGGRNHFPDGLTYHGPCLTPIEVEALTAERDDWVEQARNAIEDAEARVEAARRDGIEAALNACLRREHFHTVDDYDGVNDDLRADGARGCIAAIRALLEDGR